MNKVLQGKIFLALFCSLVCATEQNPRKNDLTWNDRQDGTEDYIPRGNEHTVQGWEYTAQEQEDTLHGKDQTENLYDHSVNVRNVHRFPSGAVLPQVKHGERPSDLVSKKEILYGDLPEGSRIQEGEVAESDVSMEDQRESTDSLEETKEETKEENGQKIFKHTVLSKEKTSEVFCKDVRGLVNILDKVDIPPEIFYQMLELAFSTGSGSSKNKQELFEKILDHFDPKGMTFTKVEYCLKIKKLFNYLFCESNNRGDQKSNYFGQFKRLFLQYDSNYKNREYLNEIMKEKAADILREKYPNFDEKDLILKYKTFYTKGVTQLEAEEDIIRRLEECVIRIKKDGEVFKKTRAKPLNIESFYTLMDAVASEQSIGQNILRIHDYFDAKVGVVGSGLISTKIVSFLEHIKQKQIKNLRENLQGNYIDILKEHFDYFKNFFTNFVSCVKISSNHLNKCSEKKEEPKDECRDIMDHVRKTIKKKLPGIIQEKFSGINLEDYTVDCPSWYSDKLTDTEEALRFFTRDLKHVFEVVRANPEVIDLDILLDALRLSLCAKTNSEKEIFFSSVEKYFHDKKLIDTLYGKPKDSKYNFHMKKIFQEAAEKSPEKYKNKCNIIYCFFKSINSCSTNNNIFFTGELRKNINTILRDLLQNNSFEEFQFAEREKKQKDEVPLFKTKKRVHGEVDQNVSEYESSQSCNDESEDNIMSFLLEQSRNEEFNNNLKNKKNNKKREVKLDEKKKGANLSNKKGASTVTNSFYNAPKNPSKKSTKQGKIQNNPRIGEGQECNLEDYSNYEEGTYGEIKTNPEGKKVSRKDRANTLRNEDSNDPM